MGRFEFWAGRLREGCAGVVFLPLRKSHRRPDKVALREEGVMCIAAGMINSSSNHRVDRWSNRKRYKLEKRTHRQTDSREQRFPTIDTKQHAHTHTHSHMACRCNGMFELFWLMRFSSAARLEITFTNTILGGAMQYPRHTTTEHSRSGCYPAIMLCWYAFPCSAECIRKFSFIDDVCCLTYPWRDTHCSLFKAIAVCTFMTFVSLFVMNFGFIVLQFLTINTNKTVFLVQFQCLPAWYLKYWLFLILLSLYNRGYVLVLVAKSS